MFCIFLRFVIFKKKIILLFNDDKGSPFSNGLVSVSATAPVFRPSPLNKEQTGAVCRLLMEQLIQGRLCCLLIKAVDSEGRRILCVWGRQSVNVDQYMGLSSPFQSLCGLKIDALCKNAVLMSTITAPSEPILRNRNQQLLWQWQGHSASACFYYFIPVTSTKLVPSQVSLAASWSSMFK